jgi:hypothetical protein
MPKIKKPKVKGPPKKRGRKPKPKSNVPKPPPKKRGRKPKGGKIVTKIPNPTNTIINKQPNIILQLKCNSKDLDSVNNFNVNYTPQINNPESYNILSNTKMYELPYTEIETEKKSIPDRKSVV